MAALLTIHNAGPDEAVVLVGGRLQCRIPPGRQLSMSCSKPVKFENSPKLSAQELAEHMGIPVDKLQDSGPGRYASEEM